MIHLSDQHSIEDGTISGIPPKGGLGILMQKHGGIYGPLMQVGEAIMRSPGVFSQAEREMIGAYISDLSRCAFCRSAHYTVAEALGIEDPAGKVEDPDSKFAIALHVARKAATQHLKRGDVIALMDAGYPEEAAEEIIHITAFFGFMNRVANSYNLAPTPKDNAMAARLAQGYSAPGQGA